MKNNLVENSNKFITLLVQANQLRQQKKYGQVAKNYEEIIRQFGETADIDQVIAWCYFNLGYEGDEAYFREAVTWAKRAIGLEPNNSHLYVTLGQIHWLGTLEYEDAALAYKFAIKIDPSNVDALVSGAALYGVPEKVVTLNEAIIWLERAVQVEPYDPNYHLNLGNLYLEAGDLSKAENECKKALLCPHSIDVSRSTSIRKLMEVYYK